MTSTIQQIMNNSDFNYCKMPDGTLIQWGTTSVSALTTTVQMPMPFKDKSYYALVNLIANSNSATNITAITMSSTDHFAIGVNTLPSGGARWLAIGRWK